MSWEQIGGGDLPPNTYAPTSNLAVEAENIPQDIVDYWNNWTDDEDMMDIITSDEAGMANAASTEFIMDLITDKQMPMDKVTDKTPAMDKVTDKEMPMDKVTDKEMPMEVLSDKQFSFDFVLDNISKSAVQQFLVNETTAKSMAVGKFVQGGAFIDNTGVSSENVTNIDTLTDSNDRMNEVTDSERAMDGVTQLAMDKVTDKEMPMDKVTDKEMPMDKIMNSLLGRTIFLSSEFDETYTWAKVDSSERVWEEFSLSGTARITSSGTFGGEAIETGDDSGSFNLEFDLTNFDTLIFVFDASYQDNSEARIRINVDGDTIHEESNDRSEYKLELSINDYTGESNVEVECDQSGGFDLDTVWHKIKFE